MPLTAPCPNCGEQCHHANSLLYCPECRRFVGRASAASTATAAGGPIPAFAGADLAPSREVIEANASLDRAHAFEEAEQFAEAATLYSRLGLEDEVERMEQAIAEHPSEGREIPDD